MLNQWLICINKNQITLRKYPLRQLHLSYFDALLYLCNQKDMVKFSISERYELLGDYQRSGLKISAFCRLRGVNIKPFGNWKRQFIDGISPRSQRTETPRRYPKVIASQNGCDYALCPPAIHPLRVIDDTAPQTPKPPKSQNHQESQESQESPKYQEHQNPQESPQPPTITLHLANGVIAHIIDTATQEITQLINHYHQCSR